MYRYHPCSHPLCAQELDHWILRSDFDENYRQRGRTTWICPLGHANSVLPSDQEIYDINKSILFHPEYYTASAAYDACPMRRYRLCPFCVVEGGCLMLASHADGCKQWPGGASSKHQHCFCFYCTRLFFMCVNISIL